MVISVVSSKNSPDQMSSQVAGCRCTLLAGNSSISLAGSEEQISFSQHSPKMLKMASESFIYALLLLLYRSFSQNFILGATDSF